MRITYQQAYQEANALGRLAMKLSAPPPDSDFWYKPAGAIATTITGIYVTPQSSLQSIAVSACRNVIAQTLASLPLNVYRRLPDGGREIDREHSVYPIVHDNANEELTSFEFWEGEIGKVLTFGNSYSLIELGPRDAVTGLIPLRPDYMQVKRDPQTKVKYYEYRSPGTGKPEIYLDDQILHIPGAGYTQDGLIGYSPVEMHRRSIEMGQAAEEYGARFFLNNGVPPQYISFPGALNDKTRENLFTWFMDRFGGLKNAHKLGVLDMGGKIETVPINHRDIQFLELRKFQLEEICRIFRVPLHMVQSLDHATNNNIEAQGINFVMHTIRPWAAKIEKRLNKSLLGPREAKNWFIEFNLDGLLRGDSIARATYYTGLRNAGIITANEVRARENMNPIEGGDELLVQGAMIPVSMAGQQQQAVQEVPK